MVRGYLNGLWFAEEKPKFEVRTVNVESRKA
jgi:hypothetical protein